MADVIGWGRSSPNVNFYLEFEWVQHSAATANYSWVRTRLRCNNAGNASTATSWGQSGEQRWWSNTGHSGSHWAGSNFLPSGYGANAQRWRDEWNFDVYHDANGNATMQFGMAVEMPDNVGVFEGYSGNIALPRIPLVPYTPGTPTASDITTTSVKLTWVNGARGHANTDSVLLRRYSGTATTGPYTDYPLAATATSHTVTGLTRGQTYTFSVYNRNSDGYSPQSGGRTVTLLNTIPDKPPTPVAISQTNSSITLSIKNPAYTGGNLTSRQIQYSPTPDFSSEVELANSPSGAPDTDGIWKATLTIPNLDRYTRYWVRHRVQNAIGWSAWSDTLDMGTLADLPSAPSGYSATDIASNTAYSTMPVVSDAGGAPLINLRHQFATTQNTGATINTLDRYGLPFMAGLTANTTYWYRISVENVMGWSAWGPWVSFATKNNVPSAPASVSVNGITNTTAQLNWAAPTNLYGSTITGYTIRVAPNRDFGTGVAVYNLAAGVTNKVMDGLQPGTEYYAQIWANTSNGFGSYSTVQTFTTTGTAPGAKPLWVRVAGVWRPGIPWVKVNGVWRQGVIWRKVSGVWRKL
ncbi:minor tail protein [Microbacterium phage Arete]|uniref:Minor tail protein n=1 Tax=Microbacterium phage Arete TaxID=2713257 RepID=A0A6G8R126_9CAUD|nr:minor tail protein [Microbacterium phage Arete]QIN93915.1 minor tail protein [Microbacterium phage Arete]